MPYQHRSGDGRLRPALAPDESTDVIPIPHLEDVIRDFITFIRVQRGLTQSTQNTYRRRLTAFVDWLKSNNYPKATIAALTSSSLTGYLHFLRKNNKRLRTVRAIFAPIRSLANFMVEAGMLETNPVSRVKLPQSDAVERPQVSEEEVSALIAACERLPLKNVAFSRAVLDVLVYAGLRPQELLDLKVGDIKVTERSILVRSGKGSKSRKL